MVDLDTYIDNYENTNGTTLTSIVLIDDYYLLTFADGTTKKVKVIHKYDSENDKVVEEVVEIG